MVFAWAMGIPRICGMKRYILLDIASPVIGRKRRLETSQFALDESSAVALLFARHRWRIYDRQSPEHPHRSDQWRPDRAGQDRLARSHQVGRLDLGRGAATRH